MDTAILSLIVLNVGALVVDTMPSVHARYGPGLAIFEAVSVAVFTVEYLLRVWSCTEGRRYAHPIRGRVRFALTPLALVDLLAVLPFYLPMLGIDLRVARLLRLFRVLRVAKLARYSTALQTLGRALRRKRGELLVTLSLAAVMVVLSASLMYFAEHEAQPDTFSSIPATMWWAVVTLTTVGYGDVYPVTVLGRVLAAAIAVFAVGMFALPTGVLGSAFVDEVERGRRTREAPRCPACGARVPAPPED